jgi:hypothetical protein
MHKVIEKALGHQPCTSHHAGRGIGGKELSLLFP